MMHVSDWLVFLLLEATELLPTVWLMALFPRMLKYLAALVSDSQ